MLSDESGATCKRLNAEFRLLSWPGATGARTEPPEPPSSGVCKACTSPLFWGHRIRRRAVHAEPCVRDQGNRSGGKHTSREKGKGKEEFWGEKNRSSKDKWFPCMLLFLSKCNSKLKHEWQPLLWKKTILPLSPKGYSDKAMNENVMSLTAIYLKCVTTSLNTPSPHPSTFSSAAACSPTDAWNLFTAGRVNRGSKSMYREGGSWGIMIIFHGKSIFHYEREMLWLLNLPLIYACISEGRWKHSSSLAFSLSIWLATVHHLFSWGKIKEQYKSQRKVRTWGQILK